MNLKITGRFILTIVLITIIVIFINTIAGIGFVMKRLINEDNEITDFSPEDFTRKFAQYLIVDGDEVSMHERGQEILDNEELWIQVLNQDGNEVYNYNKPKGVEEHYTPMELIHAYKYVLSESMSTIFIGEKNMDGINYSYILGFPSKETQRTVLSYEIDQVLESIRRGAGLVLLISISIALIFGYLFSRRLTKPLEGIIHDVEILSEGKFDLEREEKGVYKQIYKTINNLSAKLRSSEETRRNLDKMREEWISNISHDIKTPLVSVKGYAEILGDEEYHLTEEEASEYGKIIESNANYIKELIDDLNLSTRLKNKSLNLNFKKVNIIILVRSVVIDVLNNPNTNNVSIDFSAEKEVLEKNVDEVLIKRVIINLLYNAIVHNDENVSIEVKVEKREKIHIFIVDNGREIEEAAMNHIFDRYYRGTNTGTKHKGSGLGMAIARDIVEAHNGSIQLKSELGAGTEVEIIL